MYRVLLPIDDSEARAASQARTVTALPCADTDVHATLLHVFDDTDRAAETDPSQLTAGTRAKEILGEAGVSVDTESTAGKPAEEIVAAAERLNADAIVMGGRKLSPGRSLLFGSVSQAVTLEADVPVTITGDEVTGDPDYVCASCGERYYTDSEVTKCNNCGGVKIERPGEEKQTA